MAKWRVTIYELTGVGGWYTPLDIENDLLSAKLQYTKGDTNKFTFSISSTVQFISNMLPLKSYVTVDRVGSTTRRMFVGLVEKRTYSVLDGVYTFECCGGLGAQKYFPPYRDFAPGTDIQTIVDEMGKRYLGSAVPPYKTYADMATIFQNTDLVPYYGAAQSFIFGLSCNSSITQLNDSAATAYDFYKGLVNMELWEDFPNDWEPLFLWESNVGRIIIQVNTPDFPVQTQEIRYDRNLISCEITETPYPTVMKVVGGNTETFVEGPDYPFPLNFNDVILPAKSGGNYSATELQNYANARFSEPYRIITASAFDEGILDNGTPFLDISAPVNLIYLDNGAEVTVKTDITSITYDLTNPSRDRVQLGKKIIPLTQRS